MTAILIYKKRIGVIKKDINELRDKIVELALLQHHKLYEHGMHGENTFDCAGFVWYVYHEILGINIYEQGYGKSTTTKIMTSIYGNIVPTSDILKGDILFFHRQSKEDNEPTIYNKYPGHCGIYLGNNRFIHASGTKRKVIINNFSKSKYWNDVLVSGKSIISEEKTIIKTR